jgi:hypothetical protein
MPDFIKGLGDIMEGCGAVGFVFNGFIDSEDDAMCLFSGGVSLPEAELMGRYYAIVFDEDFRYNRQETDWPLRGEGMGGFPGFRIRMMCATFHWEGK